MAQKKAESESQQSREFNHQECATVLAALRIFQQIWEVDAESHYSRQTLSEMEHFEDGTQPLTPEQIDALCESINLA
jgi:hypothetical protein